MVGAMLFPFLVLTSASAQDGQASNLVTVTGAAEKTLIADQATLSVGGDASNADLATARSTAERIRDRAAEAARKAIPKAKVFRVLPPTIYPEYESFARGPGETAKVKNYLVRANMEIGGVDLDKLDALKKTVAAAGGSGAEPVEYGFKDASAVRRAVLREAFLDAQSKAREIAGAAGLKLGEVSLIEGGAGPTISPVYVDGPLLPQSSMSSAVLTNKLRVNGSLNVRFRLVR